ncbi:hypothetical protein EOA25_04395 [Mesorhizobium sp. M2A.F.Ca.ET.040.01.1.1]|nr:hypothetical protein EOA25_04395 [Mesorhizobium sp. M2A.F.Ca.ET.040.01.1.1]
MKLFLRPLFFLSCLAIAAIALTPVLFTAPVMAETVVAAPHDLVTAIVVADVMRIVTVALAILVVCLVALALGCAAGRWHRAMHMRRYFDGRWLLTPCFDPPD